MKNILITGANRGIGLMFARSFGDIVKTVYATARDLNNCDELFNVIGCVVGIAIVNYYRKRI